MTASYFHSEMTHSLVQHTGAEGPRCVPLGTAGLEGNQGLQRTETQHRARGTKRTSPKFSTHQGMEPGSKGKGGLGKGPCREGRVTACEDARQPALRLQTLPGAQGAASKAPGRRGRPGSGKQAGGCSRTQPRILRAMGSFHGTLGNSEINETPALESALVV